MSAKMATLCLLKIKLFWNKGYDVIIFVHDITNKILSCDSNHIVDVVMWPNFGNSSISMREVTITSVLQGFDKENHFFWGAVLVLKFNNLGLTLGKNLKFYSSVGKLGANCYVCRSYSGKTGRERGGGMGGGGFAPLSLITLMSFYFMVKKDHFKQKLLLWPPIPSDIVESLSMQM